MKRILSKILVFLLFCLSAGMALAQPPFDPNDPGPAHGIPIDGGASALLAGGIGYAIKRLKDKRR